MNSQSSSSSSGITARSAVGHGLRDLALLAARVGLGVVLMVHGWQKWSQNGLGATADGFAAMGVPAASVAAAFAATVELVGGALVVLGLATRVVGVLVAVNMAGAWWFAHRGAGVLVTEGGGELVATLGLLAVVLAAVGAGRLSGDRLVLGRRAVAA